MDFKEILDFGRTLYPLSVYQFLKGSQNVCVNGSPPLLNHTVRFPLPFPNLT